MEIDLYQVDAFSPELFKGNPAAVCPLDDWIPDDLMQQIALENNLSETAFLVRENGQYGLRWFTPRVEVDLCGHATLAASHVLFEHRGFKEKTILFKTRSGILTVERHGEEIVMNFPANVPEEADPPQLLVEALGIAPEKCYRGQDYMLVFETENQIRAMDPDFMKLRDIDTRGIIVTAPGTVAHFVSRFFAPAVGINEDPVTGSAHTMLTPYWSERLNKKEMIARQLSERGGELIVRMLEDQVGIAGQACTYLQGTIEVPVP